MKTYERGLKAQPINSMDVVVKRQLSMIALSSRLTFYYAIRACLSAVGLLLVLLAFGALLYPDVVRSEGSIPPRWQQLIFDFALLLYGLSLLAPHRWFLRQPLFNAKMLVFLIGLLWTAYLFSLSFLDFTSGEKSLLVVLLGFIFILMATVAPFTLWWKRNLKDRIRC